MEIINGLDNYKLDNPYKEETILETSVFSEKIYLNEFREKFNKESSKIEKKIHEICGRLNFCGYYDYELELPGSQDKKGSYIMIYITVKHIPDFDFFFSQSLETQFEDIIYELVKK